MDDMSHIAWELCKLQPSGEHLDATPYYGSYQGLSIGSLYL